MDSKETWKDFFGMEYLLFSESILTPERTAFEVNQLERLLCLPKGSKILDLGCGQGRISTPLALLGYRVTGLDGSQAMIEAAKQRTRAAGVEVRLIHSDMQNFDSVDEYDAVINIGTAFGYVQNEAEDIDIMNRIYKALKPGGLFVQETENRDFRISRHIGKTWVVINNNTVWSDRLFDSVTGRWRETLSWIHDGTLQSKVLDLRLYSTTELIRMTREAKLQVLNVYGGFDFSELQLHSPRLVIVSKK